MGYRRNTKKAIAMAHAAGFDTAVYVGEWEEHDVYEPRFKDNVMRYLGYPQFILGRGMKLRWTSDNEESISVLHHINK